MTQYRKTSLDQLTVEEIHDGSSDINSDDEVPGTKRNKNDSGKQQGSGQQSGSCKSKESSTIDQQPGATEKKRQELPPKCSDALNDSENPSEDTEVLAGIADTFKLDVKKAPAGCQ